MVFTYSNVLTLDPVARAGLRSRRLDQPDLLARRVAPHRTIASRDLAA